MNEESKEITYSFGIWVDTDFLTYNEAQDLGEEIAKFLSRLAHVERTFVDDVEPS